MTWKYLYASVKGSSHIYNGSPCQDYSTIKLVEIDSGDPILIACAADGAGSATHSKLGSRLACTFLIQTIENWLKSDNRLDAINEEVVKNWFIDVQKGLNTIAERKALPGPKSLATTLMMAIISSNVSIFAQIGDGAIVFWEQEDYKLAFWPQNGEYQNTTYFVTDEKSLQHLQFKRVEASVEEVALLTDGLQMLALEYEHQRPYNRFFTPIFGRIRQQEPGYALNLKDSLKLFLTSDKVNERTDDDKTLILVTRKTEELASAP